MLKDLQGFAKALATKSVLRMFLVEYLWQEVMINKYNAPKSIKSWIKEPRKSYSGGSMVWKTMEELSLSQDYEWKNNETGVRCIGWKSMCFSCVQGTFGSFRQEKYIYSL